MCYFKNLTFIHTLNISRFPLSFFKKKSLPYFGKKKKKKDSYYKTITIISPSISLYLGTNISDFDKK